MKRIIMFVLLFAALKVAGQTTGYLRFDTVKIMKQNGTCELYIINKTKDSLGLLTNVGGGLTQFRKSKMLNDSTIIIGLDTLLVRGTGNSGGSATLSNVGSGYRLVKTADGQVKTIFVGYGLDADSTTNTDAITFKADTAELVTPSDLNDAIAGVGGSGDITSNVFKDSSFVPLIVFFGESNAAGDGDNANASAGEIDADPRVQIIQSAGAFAALNIGSNNNFAVSAGRHGWELELQNQIATRFNNRTVYLVKAGIAGSAISQWQIGTANYDTLVNRMNNAIARIYELGKVPVICGWYSQGINDGVLGTNETTWYNNTLTLFNNVRGKYGFFPIIMTQLIGDRTTYPQLDAIDTKIIQIAADRNNYVYRVLTPQGPIGGASTDSIIAGGIHWSYLGLKAITNRMLNAMMDTAGYINYDRRIKNVADYAWRKDGNIGTTASNFIGTTDNVGLIFKTNNIESFRIDGSQQVGIGVTSPTRMLDVNGDIKVNGIIIGRGGGNVDGNTVVGAGGAFGSNTTGFASCIYGYGAAPNSNGAYNSIFGTQAFTGTGDQNCAFGFHAGYGLNLTRCVLIGSEAATGASGTRTDEFWLANTGTNNLAFGNFSTGQMLFNAGSSPSLTASAQLEVKSTTRGFLTPVMTAAQRIAISSPATGLEVFDTDSLRKMMYDGSAWKAVAWTTDVSGGGLSGSGTSGRVAFWNGSSSLTSASNYLFDGNTLTVQASGGASAIYGSGNSGPGVVAESITGEALTSSIIPSSTNSIATVGRQTRNTSGTAANGIGGTYDFFTQSSNGSAQRSNRIGSLWADATTATRTSTLEIYGVNSGTEARKAALSGAGQWTWDTYGSGTHTVTPATTPVYSSSGVIGERIAPKIYTALLTATTGNAPTATVLGTNEIGSIVWTRVSDGNYTGTLSSAFTANKTWAMVQRGDMTGNFVNNWISSGTTSTVTLTVSDNVGNPVGDFTNMSIEIRVYP